MSTRHKHYDVIVAFAEGRAVQYRATASDTWKGWNHTFMPSFDPTTKTEYRIKPQKAWRWVVSPVDNPNDVSITRGHFSDTEDVRRYFSEIGLSVHQRILSTEREM